MSIYTTSINEVLNNYLSPITDMDLNELIDKTYNKYFTFNFPWYSDENSKIYFEKMFLRHYMTYEIGQETLGKHKLMLQSRLFKIMPEYENAFKAMNLDMLWGNNVDMDYNETEQVNGEFTESGNSSNTHSITTSQSENAESNDKSNGSTAGKTTSNTSQNTQSINSDNPQINFSGTDYASSMERGEVIGESSTDSSDTTTVTTERASEKSSSSEQNYDASETTKKDGINEQNKTNHRTESGNNGLTRGEVYKEMLNSFININSEIIDRCSDLFLMVY